MFKSRFLGAFFCLSIISNIFAVEFSLGDKKIDVSIPAGFTFVGESSDITGTMFLEYDYLLNNVAIQFLSMSFYPNQNFIPKYAVNATLTNIRNSGVTVEVFEKYNNQNDGCLVYSAFVKTIQDTQKRIFFISCISFGHDLAGIMYGIDINPTMTEEQAIEKIKKFALENIKFL